MNQSGFHVYRGSNPIQKRRYAPNYNQMNRASGLSASFGQPTTTANANYGVTRFENMLVDAVADSQIDSQQPVPPADDASTPNQPAAPGNKKFVDKYKTGQPTPAQQQQQQQQQEMIKQQQVEKQKRDKRNQILMYSGIAIACVVFVVLMIAVIMWFMSSPGMSSESAASMADSGSFDVPEATNMSYAGAGAGASMSMDEVSQAIASNGGGSQ